MREIAPYPAPKERNLIETLQAGELVIMEDIDPKWEGHVSVLREDGRLLGTLIYLPSVEPPEAFPDVDFE